MVLPAPVPCPKCGVPPTNVGSGMVDQLACQRCGRSTDPYFDGFEYATDEWNRKAQGPHEHQDRT